MFGENFVNSFVRAMIMVITTYLSGYGLKLLKVHFDINEVDAMRAVVVLKSHYLMINEVALIILFLNLMVVGILLEIFVKFLAMITVIVNRPCT